MTLSLPRPGAQYDMANEASTRDALQREDAKNLKTSLYKEGGVWTPVDGSGASLAFTNNTGIYIRFGKLVWFSGRVDYPSTANGNAAVISGLPILVDNVDAAISPFPVESAAAVALQGLTTKNTNKFAFVQHGTVTAITNAQLSTKTIRFAGLYQSA